MGRSRHPIRMAQAICLALLATGSGRAQMMSDATDMDGCTITAWAIDRDPAGLNVRAGPGVGHEVIGRLPPPQDVYDEEFATEVEIVDSQDGWFRIKSATTDNYIVEDGPTTVFEGDGWVSGRFLGISIEGSLLRDAPASHAPVIFDFNDRTGAEKGADYFDLERLRACRGWWLEVEGTYFGKRVRGWTDDTCANQVTTCS